MWKTVGLERGPDSAPEEAEQESYSTNSVTLDKRSSQFLNLLPSMLWWLMLVK